MISYQGIIQLSNLHTQKLDQQDLCIYLYPNFETEIFIHAHKNVMFFE